MALDYGAGLIFTSAVGEGINIELLQDYIHQRVFDFPFTYQPKVSLTVLVVHFQLSKRMVLFSVAP